ncbi:cytochrome c biogenesis heme-transporting ATPase CcmA [Aquisalimonas lutea]|uniref:cytochrome c biogenesis heme-transporting ATPase CcmA n=1 Tax=Aquisalimonas lutea TaxID=1327750 RepID=UPI0025B400F3|nr:cytochrome c biogenesis heme-transporting ATPase CcmA [Aquisalimonas lutea]MDN3519075.1 cytochrome c biogenesis heme-transporting ATPase CcmA [Aquisalimonas lutea]
MLNLNDVFLTRGERPLLSNLSLALSAGEALHVRGANGSGKTTLLRAIAGLTPLEHGRIDWRGRDIRRSSDIYRSEMLFVGHQSGLKMRMTPKENLEHYRRIRPGRDISTTEALAAMGIGGAAQLPCGVLSAGQCRRTTLARLLCEQAELWILDEPFTALDTEGAGCLSRLIEAHVRTGGIAILTSHQLVPMDISAFRTLDLPHA